jgi:hypothetical protein
MLELAYQNKVTAILTKFPRLTKIKIILLAATVSKQLETVYYCMPLDDGLMTETCCGNNIGRGEEEVFR